MSDLESDLSKMGEDDQILSFRRSEIDDEEEDNEEAVEVCMTTN